MTEMLLLGAGASVDAGVPGSYSMSSEILERVLDETHRRVITLVMGGLLFQLGASGANPFEAGIDVESLFRAVQLLAERQKSEASPFVNSWNYFVDDLDRPQLQPGMMAEFFQSLGGAITGGQFSGYLATRELTRLIEQRLPRSGGGTVFRDTNEAMIDVLRDIVWINEADRVEYLSPLLRLLNTQKRLVIATLNYDNSIELLAKAYRLHCDTAIENWLQTGNLEHNGDGLFLLKLHGSIDWEMISRQTSIDRPIPHSVIRRRSPEKMARRHELRQKLLRADLTPEDVVRTEEDLKDEEYRPALIFGHANKLTPEGPFLDKLRAFRRELANADTLSIIGYSFRDAHVNEYLTQWLHADSRNRIRIINGPKFEQNHSNYARLLLTHVRQRIEIIPAYARDALSGLWKD